MKEKIKKIIGFLNQWKIILIILLIGAGLFYWYEWRPSQIRKECSKELRRIGSLEARELFYKTCLQERGLEK